MTITVTRLTPCFAARIDTLGPRLPRTRGAYPSLPEALKRRVERATVVHDFSWSRDQVRPGFFTDKERPEYSPVRHPLVRANPVNGTDRVRGRDARRPPRRPGGAGARR
jgi:hypothetical protein